jgi:flagellar biosynthetic protein FlhB
LFIDLQWFAAEDEGRTQDPTDQTYRKAREEGRVAKSQDLVGAIGLLLPAVAIFFLAPGMLRTCSELLRFFFTRINDIDPIRDRMVAVLFLRYFVSLALPILTVAVTAALFSNLIQTGFLFTTKPLVPDFSRVLPRFGKYFQRTLFSVEGLFNFAKSIAKMAIIGVTAFIIIRSRINQLINLQTMDLWTGISLIASLAARVLIICALLLLVLSVPDFLFQRWQFRESLKMTREQAKEEMKQTEGDPQVRARLRRRYQELLTRDLSRVPQADVVITNPTHYSVALQYDAGLMEGPMVVAKGEDELAMRIREIARANDVPVVSHPPLTRAIYSETESGETVPVKYWRVIVLLLGKFFDVDRKMRPRNRREQMRMEA